MKNLSKKSAPAQGSVIDDVTVYSFGHKHSLTIDVNDFDEYAAFAKYIEDSVPVRESRASLTTLNITGDYLDKVARIDGQTLDTVAGGTTIDSTIEHLNLAIMKSEVSSSSSVSLSNFDRLETVDATSSTEHISLVLSEQGMDGRSTSAYLHSIEFASGSASVSTVAAAEFDSVASLAHARVKDISVSASNGNIGVTAIIQQADVNIEARHGSATVDLSFVKGVDAHNASSQGSLGHGVNIVMSGEGSGNLTLFNGNLVNYEETASSAEKSASIIANLVKVTGFDVSDSYILYGFPVGKPEAVATIADSAVAGAKDISTVLDIVSKETVGEVNAAVFHYHGNTYVFQDAQPGYVAPPSVDSEDSLIELVGGYDLNDVAAHVVAGIRGMGH